MHRRDFLTGAAAAALAGEINMTDPSAPNPGIEVAAYYFPNYHPDARNDRWHGKGWTEWELVKAARPRFQGHRQPIVPAWGYFDESDPNWAEKEIDLAANHGLTAFLYDWYWYEDGPFLQDGLEKGFLRAANTNRMKFGLMWANHDWLNIHPANFNNKPETLAKGRVSRAGFDRLVDHVCKTYLTRPNYLKIDGCPYFSIYEMGTFIAGLGGLPQAREALDSFRARVKGMGFPDLHVNGILWGVKVLPSELGVSDPARVVRELGISSIGSYTWIHYYSPDEGGFPRSSYAKAAERNLPLWEEHTRAFPVPYHPNVTMGWDSSPRTVQTDHYEARGYPWTAVLEGNTPEAFESALRRAREFLVQPRIQQKVLTINAWNEWTEGSYLLPDKTHGTKYLEAIKRVFGA